MAVGAKDFNVGSVPIVSRLWQKVDERTIGRNINERYYHAVDEAETTADRLGQYKKKARLGSIEYADASIDFKRLNREIEKNDRTPPKATKKPSAPCKAS